MRTQRSSTAEDERRAKDLAEIEAEGSGRLEAVENDRVASRKATEGSRGKRRRGGALGTQGAP
jgi:hypothetical protein